MARWSWSSQILATEAEATPCFHDLGDHDIVIDLGLAFTHFSTVASAFATFCVSSCVVYTV